MKKAGGCVLRIILPLLPFHTFCGVTYFFPKLVQVVIPLVPPTPVIIVFFYLFIGLPIFILIIGAFYWLYTLGSENDSYLWGLFIVYAVCAFYIQSLIDTPISPQKWYEVLPNCPCSKDNPEFEAKEQEFNNLGICHCEEERRSNLWPAHGDCFGLMASQ